jgi:hypothetical protein
MCDVVGVIALQNSFGASCATFNGDRGFDHFVVLLLDQIPADRACECSSEVRITFRHSFIRKIEPLILDAFEPRHKPNRAEQMAKGKGHFRLAVAIDEVLLNTHLGVVSNKTFYHRGNLGIGKASVLRIDANGVGFDVPINHHTIAFVARAPLGHRVLLPTLETRAIRREVLQLCSHAVIGWLDAPSGLFGLRSIQMASI